MNFTCNADVLKDYIVAAEGLVNKNSSTFSDHYIRLSTLNNRLDISIGTHDYFANLYLDNINIKTAGVACSENIAAFIKALGDSSKEIEIDCDNKNIIIKRGTSKKGKMPAVPVANFIDRSAANSTQNLVFSLSVAELRSIIDGTLLIKLDSIRQAVLKQLHFHSVNGQVVCFFGNATSMFRHITQSTITDINLSISLEFCQQIKTFLSLKQLTTDSAVEFYQSGNSILLKTSCGELRLGSSAFEYPAASVIKMFNLDNWQTVNLSIAELIENFKAIDGLFNSYDDVLCQIESKNDSFYITNSVKNIEYEGIIKNPDNIDLNFYINTDTLAVGCKFIKDKDGEFITKLANTGLAAFGIKSKTRTFITVPIRKEMVKA